MKLLKANGEISEFRSVGEKPTLEEMQKAVGGLIEIVSLRSSIVLVINEEGKLKGLPVNMPATVMYQDLCHTEDIIVGDCLLAYSKEID